MIPRNNTFVLYKIGENSLLYRISGLLFKALLSIFSISLLLHILFEELNLFMDIFVISMILLIINSIIGSIISPNVIDIGCITFHEDLIEINSNEEEKQYSIFEDLKELIVSVGGYKGNRLYIMSFSTGRGLSNYVKLTLKENNQLKKYRIKLMNRNQFLDLREIRKFYKEKLSI